MLIKLSGNRLVNVLTGTLIHTYPNRTIPTVEYRQAEALAGADALLVIDAIQEILLRQHCELQDLLNTRYALAPGTVELRDGEPVAH